MIPHHHKTKEDPMYHITVSSTAHRQFHDEVGVVERAPSPVKTEDLLRMGRKMTIHQEEVKLNLLKIIYSFLILSSLALDVFAWVTWKQTESYLLLAIAATTVMTTVGSVFGLVGAFVAIEELKARPQNPTQLISNTPGQSLIILSFYFLLYIFSSYLVFGSGALFFQDQSLTFLEARHSDEAAWALSFQNKDLSAVQDFTSLMITVAGYACYITNVIIGVSIYYIFVLSAVWEVIHKVLLVICIVLLCLGLGILYLAGLGEIMIAHLDFQDIVPDWVSLAAVVVGALICTSAFQGYAMAHTEKRGLIRCFLFLELLVIGISLVFASGALLSATRFRDKLNTSCYDTLALIDQDFTKFLGCDAKYTESSYTETGLSCPKEQMRVIWEKDYESGGVSYGCLNSECCGSLVATAKSIFDYMAIQALATVLIAGVAFWGISYLIEKVNKFGVSANHETDYRFFISMLLFSAFAALLLYTNLKFEPRQPLHKEALLVVNNGGLLDPRFLVPGNCFTSLQWTDPPSDSAKCEVCDQSKTVVFIEVKNGKIFKPTTMISVDDMEFGAGKWRFSLGKSAGIRKIIEEMTVCPLCPNTDFQMGVQIGQMKTDGQSLVTLYNLTYDFSVKTNFTQTLTGKISGSPKSSVPVTAEIPSCQSFTSVTDADGRYVFSLPQTVDLSPYFLLLSVPSGAKRVQQVGGVPQTDLYVPTIIQVSQSNLYSRVKTKVVDSAHGFPIGNATVSIRENANNVTGPSLKSVLTDVDGTATFQDLPPGLYTLVASADKYLSDVVDTLVEGGRYADLTLQLGIDNLTPKQTRLTLTWEPPSLDLDLRADFQVSDSFFCHVYYAENFCGSAKLTKQTNPAVSGEVLTLKEISAGRYLIYVTQYLSRESIKSVPVSKTKAELKVYIPGLKLPLVRLQVPEDGTGSNDE